MLYKNIAVIGATGGTGKEVIQFALKQGCMVTAIARNPGSINLQQNLTVVSGDVMNADSLVKAFSNIDAVISCFGPANNFKAGNLMSVGMQHIIEACKEAGVNRLVFMSGILQSDGRELSPMNRLGQKFIRLFYQKIYKDKKIAENLVTNSSLDWTIVRAVGLNNSKATGNFNAGVKLSVVPFKPLSYADCAACLVKAVTEQNWMKAIVNVGTKE